MPLIRKPDCGHSVLKTLVFIYNVFFWLVGTTLLGVGIYADSEIEKRNYEAFNILVGTTLLGVGIYAEIEKRNYQAVNSTLLSPSTVLIVVGAFMFVLTFIGCVGALRENITLLKIFGWTITIVFLLQLVAAITAIVFKTKAKSLVSKGFSGFFDVYYDDPDIHYVIDEMQQELECCGGYDFNDWNKNVYFACEGKGNCGVPYSCCISAKTDMVANTQCGWGIREGNPSQYAVDDTIFVRGCTDAVLVWFEDHLNIFLGLTLGVCVPQILGCFLTFLFIIKIQNAEQIEYDDVNYSDAF